MKTTQQKMRILYRKNHIIKKNGILDKRDFNTIDFIK